MSYHDKCMTVTMDPAAMTATTATPVLTVVKNEPPAPPPVPPALALPRDIVFYRLSQYDAATITARRTQAGITGNPVAAGDTYPALVVKRFTYQTVNLRVLLDGPDDLWATSRYYGDQPGQWRDYPGTSE